jgi:hypothetical protein
MRGQHWWFLVVSIKQNHQGMPPALAESTEVAFGSLETCPIALNSADQQHPHRDTALAVSAFLPQAQPTVAGRMGMQCRTIVQHAFHTALRTHNVETLDIWQVVMGGGDHDAMLRCVYEYV